MDTTLDWFLISDAYEISVEWKVNREGWNYIGALTRGNLLLID